MSDTKHKTIFEAIAKAVGEVKQLGKSDRNKFDGYDFVSIDKFLSLVNPICAAHGLFPSVNLTATEFYENTNSKGTKSTWARFNYDICLHHETGDKFGPINMMVAVPMNGAQASGSAQSYALKQFFRGMFMIPTGDKDDPDLNATEQHHNAKPEKPDIDAEAEWFKATLPSIKDADGINAVLGRAKKAGRDVSALVVARANDLGLHFDADKRCYVYLEHTDTAHDDAVKAERNGDLGGDEIPEFGDRK